MPPQMPEDQFDEGWWNKSLKELARERAICPQPDTRRNVLLAEQVIAGRSLRRQRSGEQPTLDTTIPDPSFFRPCCFAFPGGSEMFVINRGEGPSPGTGYVSRILSPLHAPRNTHSRLR
jgi:hypothetical protein